MTRSRDFRTRLVLAVVGLAAVQAATGLLWRGAYRDAPWIQASWLGNDVVTLVVAVPLLLFGLVHANRGETVGHLLVSGGLSYVVYNSAFYLFGATLNAFFPLYAGILVTGILALASVLEACCCGAGSRWGTSSRRSAASSLRSTCLCCQLDRQP